MLRILIFFMLCTSMAHGQSIPKTVFIHNDPMVTVIDQQRVMIVGGSLLSNNMQANRQAEIFDTKTGVSRSIKLSNGSIDSHGGAKKLPDGTIMFVAVASANDNRHIRPVEIYDPAKDEWKVLSQVTPSYFTFLQNGNLAYLDSKDGLVKIWHFSDKAVESTGSPIRKRDKFQIVEGTSGEIWLIGGTEQGGPKIALDPACEPIGECQDSYTPVGEYVPTSSMEVYSSVTKKWKLFESSDSSGNSLGRILRIGDFLFGFANESKNIFRAKIENPKEWMVVGQMSDISNVYKVWAIDANYFGVLGNPGSRFQMRAETFSLDFKTHHVFPTLSENSSGWSYGYAFLSPTSVLQVGNQSDKIRTYQAIPR